MSWGFRSPSGPVRVTVRRLAEGEPEVRRVSIAWGRPAGAGEATFALRDPGPHLTAEVRGLAEHLRTQPASRYPRATLVALELPNLVRDRIFLATLDVARTMATALLR